MKITKHEGEVE